MQCICTLQLAAALRATFKCNWTHYICEACTGVGFSAHDHYCIYEHATGDLQLAIMRPHVQTVPLRNEWGTWGQLPYCPWLCIMWGIRLQLPPAARLSTWNALPMSARSSTCGTVYYKTTYYVGYDMSQRASKRYLIIRPWYHQCSSSPAGWVFWHNLQCHWQPTW